MNIKNLVFIMVVFTFKQAISMERATARAFGDASTWKGQEIRGDVSSKVEEGFSYTDKITADERSRWGEVRSMDMESDTEIERLKAREKSKSTAYQAIDESSQKRIHFRDVHKEDVWSNPELLKQFENPEEVFAKTFKDCRAEPVYKTSFKSSLHKCQEGVPLTTHSCLLYLKEARKVQKRLAYDYTNFYLHHHWSGSYNVRNWAEYQRVKGFFQRGHKSRPGGFTRWPKAGDTQLDFLPEGQYVWFCGCNHWPIKVTHYHKPEKREVSVDPLGNIAYGPWISISREEYDEIDRVQLEDVWISNCEALEEKAKEGICFKTSEKCTSENKTRAVEEVEFSRECWQKEFTYECRTRSRDTCAPLREKGCHQISSKCAEHYGPECVSFDVEMECLKTVKELTDETRLVCGGAPYCMNGACHTTDYDPNKDMMSVMAKLKVLSETARHMSGGAGSLRIFRGARLQCKKDMLSFRDCCNGGSGWGVGMNLAGCGGEEQTLAKKRSKGLCVAVGTYCAHKEKLTGICLTKKTSFCCFPTKLLKIIQQQGRAQLGIGWGDPEHSDCRGLTADELSRVDFSRLNLREVEAELVSSFDISKMDSTLRERLTQIQDGMGSMTPSQMVRGSSSISHTLEKEEADA